MISWLSFLRTLILTAIGIGLFIAGFILALDPYQNVPFSLPLARAPIAGNQRFAYPALARSPQFDSVIIGTSTTRMLDPENFDDMLGAKFVNLSMNSATAYEETEILRLFLRHHQEPRYVIVGMDVSWCERRDALPRYTFRQFPEWMYDEDRWNDLVYLFNDKALENSVRMLELLIGQRSPKYRRNGYQPFLPDQALYDSVKARGKIYGSAAVRPTLNYAVTATLPALQQPSWRFAAHTLLPPLLAAIPAETQKVLLFVPYHQHVLSGTSQIYSECKGRVMKMSEGSENIHLIDFMLPSRITSVDENYWDGLHYNEAVARQVESMIVEAMEERMDRPGYYRYLRRAHLK